MGGDVCDNSEVAMLLSTVMNEDVVAMNYGTVKEAAVEDINYQRLIARVTGQPANAELAELRPYLPGKQ